MGIFSTRIPASLRSLPVRGSFVKTRSKQGVWERRWETHTLWNSASGRGNTVYRLASIFVSFSASLIMVIRSPAVNGFSIEPLTGRLLKEAGMRVEKIPMFNRTAFTATEVRKRIIEGKNWEELLPKSVAAYIKQIKGEERMREIAQTDKAN